MARVVERLDNGVTVYQVTDGQPLISNIYCERPYASLDGKRFLYARRVQEGQPWEYVLCEFGSWQEQVVGCGHLTASVSYQDDFYYQRDTANAGSEVVRIDLATGASRVAFELPPGGPHMGHPSASPNGRYIAYGVALSYAPQRFGIEVIDLQRGTRALIHEDPEICNTHAQFDAGVGDTIMVQHNRGCEFAPDGTRLLLVSGLGCTAFLLKLNGEVTRLRVGEPWSTPLTGHQAWVGTGDEIIMTVRAEGDFVEEKGNILVVRAGGDFRQLAPGRRMNHIGTTPCGRYFHADGAQSSEIIVGSPRSGDNVVICHSHATYSAGGFDQQGHPHAYLTADFRWVIFNSDRTGRPQLYAASVPAELLQRINEG